MSTPLYIVAGQSNASRLRANNSLEAYIDANSISAQVLNISIGGTSITQDYTKEDWYPFDDGDPETGELTQQLLLESAETLANDPELHLAGILWVQGERNTYSDGRPEEYEAHLSQLHDVFRSSLGDTFVFTVAQLSENMERHAGKASATTVMEAQANFASRHDNVNLLDPDIAMALSGIQPRDGADDDVHYSRAGSDVIAAAFLDQFYGESAAVVGTANYQSDEADSEDWHSKMQGFDADGNITAQHKINDNNVSVVTLFKDGTPHQMFQSDHGNRFAWDNIEQVYDDAGILVLRSKTMDDGTQYETRFEDGIRSSQTVLDGPDIENWQEYTTWFGEDGKTKLAMSFLNDDGKTRDVTYSDGQMIKEVFTDTTDSFEWAQIEKHYGPGGQQSRAIRTEDNGRVIETTFVDGVRTVQHKTDTLDEFSWHEDTHYYDVDGKTLIDRVTVFDDGRIRDTEYVDGKKTSEVFTDTTGKYDWLTMEKVFDADGVLIDRLFTYDLI